MADTRFLGPSPLTRGNLATAQPVARCEGSIPAHAGQPGTPATSAGALRVHPRSRGATTDSVVGPKKRPGPSPLTRGNREAAQRRLRGPGSIPAHAGQPVGASNGAWTSRVHPRSRGATRRPHKRHFSFTGPSPLTRGNRDAGRAPVHRRGSIPAHAGQPTTRACARWPCRVHPRSRGATLLKGIVAEPDEGPSPLTRGNPTVACPRASASGSIPAHAGQPRRGADPAAEHGVHPRSRGATSKRQRRKLGGPGPSPLTRGNQLLDFVLGLFAGSIPAHAGQPSCATCPG